MYAEQLLNTQLSKPVLLLLLPLLLLTAAALTSLLNSESTKNANEHYCASI